MQEEPDVVVSGGPQFSSEGRNLESEGGDGTFGDV